MFKAPAPVSAATSVNSHQVPLQRRRLATKLAPLPGQPPATTNGVAAYHPDASLAATASPSDSPVSIGAAALPPRLDLAETESGSSSPSVFAVGQQNLLALEVKELAARLKSMEQAYANQSQTLAILVPQMVEMRQTITTQAGEIKELKQKVLSLDRLFETLAADIRTLKLDVGLLNQLKPIIAALKVDVDRFVAKETAENAKVKKIADDMAIIEQSPQLRDFHNELFLELQSKFLSYVVLRAKNIQYTSKGSTVGEIVAELVPLAGKAVSKLGTTANANYQIKKKKIPNRTAGDVLSFIKLFMQYARETTLAFREQITSLTEDAARKAAKSYFAPLVERTIKNHPNLQFEDMAAKLEAMHRGCTLNVPLFYDTIQLHMLESDSFLPWVSAKDLFTKCAIGMPICSLRDNVTLDDVRRAHPNKKLELHHNVVWEVLLPGCEQVKDKVSGEMRSKFLCREPLFTTELTRHKKALAECRGIQLDQGDEKGLPHVHRQSMHRRSLASAEMCSSPPAFTGSGSRPPAQSVGAQSAAGSGLGKAKRTSAPEDAKIELPKLIAQLKFYLEGKGFKPTHVDAITKAVAKINYEIPAGTDPAKFIGGIIRMTQESYQAKQNCTGIVHYCAAINGMRKIAENLGWQGLSRDELAMLKIYAHSFWDRHSMLEQLLARQVGQTSVNVMTKSASATSVGVANTLSSSGDHKGASSGLGLFTPGRAVAMNGHSALGKTQTTLAHSGSRLKLFTPGPTATATIAAAAAAGSSPPKKGPPPPPPTRATNGSSPFAFIPGSVNA